MHLLKAIQITVIPPTPSKRRMLNQPRFLFRALSLSCTYDPNLDISPIRRKPNNLSNGRDRSNTAVSSHCLQTSQRSTKEPDPSKINSRSHACWSHKYTSSTTSHSDKVRSDTRCYASDIVARLFSCFVGVQEHCGRCCVCVCVCRVWV